MKSVPLLDYFPEVRMKIERRKHMYPNLDLKIRTFEHSVFKCLQRAVPDAYHGTNGIIRSSTVAINREEARIIFFRGVKISFLLKTNSEYWGLEDRDRAFLTSESWLKKIAVQILSIAKDIVFELVKGKVMNKIMGKIFKFVGNNATSMGDLTFDMASKALQGVDYTRLATCIIKEKVLEKLIEMVAGKLADGSGLLAKELLELTKTVKDLPEAEEFMDTAYAARFYANLFRGADNQLGKDDRSIGSTITEAALEIGSFIIGLFKPWGVVQTGLSIGGKVYWLYKLVEEYKFHRASDHKVAEIYNNTIKDLVISDMKKMSNDSLENLIISVGLDHFLIK